MQNQDWESDISEATEDVQAQIEIAREAVRKRYEEQRNTLQDTLKGAILEGRQGLSNAHIRAYWMHELHAFEVMLAERMSDAEQVAADMAAEFARIVARQARLEQRERANAFVTCYQSPLEGKDDPAGVLLVRREKISVQAVFLAILKSAAKTGRTTLANGQLAGMTGYCVRTIIRATERLELLGVIAKFKRADRDHTLAFYNLPNVYRLKGTGIIKWARRIFWRGGDSGVTQPRSGYNPDSTHSEILEASAAEDLPETTVICRQEADSVKGSPPAEIETTNPDMDALAITALGELGENVSTDISSAGVSQAVTRVRRRVFPEFRDGEWLRLRARLGRTADLALLETALLCEIRSGTVSDDQPEAHREPIRSPEAYLHGILRKSRALCRPQVTLGRLLTTRGRYVPRSVSDRVEEHDLKRATWRAKRSFG